MKVRILETPEQVAATAADALGRAVERVVDRNPGLVLGLPTGRTMIPFYDELARRYREGGAGHLDLSRSRGFNVDELLLPPEHPASFHSFMARHAWERIGLPRERCDIPNPTAPTAAECLRYDRAVSAAGGFDLVFLGIGADGHVAYNLPGEPHEEAHVVQVPPEVADTLDVPAPLRPLRAITLGFAPLRAARHVVLLATTPDKARAVRALVEGPEDRRWPCTLLRDHPRFQVLLTPAAARELRSARDHRRPSSLASR